jgi:membrane protein implicated in regulation of membrane protease activity
MEPTQLPLRDIHMPEAIGWWPPAMGWWLVAILAPLLIFLLIWLYKRLTRKTAIKTAKKILAQIKQDKTLDNHGKLVELSVLVRRVAISVAPREQAAGLTGQAWLAYLDSSVKGSPFSEGIGRHLGDAPYRKIQLADADIPQLISLCEDWLKAQAKK